MTVEGLDISALLLDWGPVWGLVAYLMWDRRSERKEHIEQLNKKDDIIREVLPAIQANANVLRELREFASRGHL